MNKDFNTLLEGYIDMHVHATPDGELLNADRYAHFTDNRKMIDECVDAKMGGLVLKGHCWPTMGQARDLNKEYEDIELYPSICMSSTSGGPYPWVLELAIGSGAKAAWLPGWTTQLEHEGGGYVNVLEASYPGLRERMEKSGFYDTIELYNLVDSEGNLKENIKEIVALCKEHDIPLGTGHCMGAASYEVVKFAKDIGYDKLHLTHPVESCSYNTFEQIKEFAEMGGNIELCTLSVNQAAGRVCDMDYMKKILDECGPEKCFVTTDYYFNWLPSLPAIIKSFFGDLYNVGVSWDDLVTLSQTSRRLMNKL